MKRKHWIGLVASVLVLILTIGIINKAIINHTQNKVLDYLTEVKKYKMAEISSIETSISKAPLVGSEVIFKDETNARYFYKVADGIVVQYGQAPVHGVDNGKHTYKHKENK